MPRVTPLPSTALPPAIAEVYDRFAGYGPFATRPPCWRMCRRRSIIFVRC